MKTSYCHIADRTMAWALAIDLPVPSHFGSSQLSSLRPRLAPSRQIRTARPLPGSKADCRLVMDLVHVASLHVVASPLSQLRGSPASVASRSAAGCLPELTPSSGAASKRLIVAGLTGVAAAYCGAARRRQSRLVAVNATIESEDAESSAKQEVDAKESAERPEMPLETSTADAVNDLEIFACPVCHSPLQAADAGSVCKPLGLFFPRRDGIFSDFTIGAAKPEEDAAKMDAAQAANPSSEDPGLLQRLPFVQTTDALAAAFGLPQSQEVEKLGRELLQEPQRLLGAALPPPGTSTFQNPLVSFAYERGWRSSFKSSGFPGPDEEFRLASKFLSDGSGLLGDVLLDASCGSGLFSRRFVSSGDYRTVIALDYSESMLRQVDDFAKKDFGFGYANGAPGKTALKLVRADIARLPFASNSLGGVHAGAAIHCWPSPENAIAEVARVLRPGGVFVLSTFMPRGPLSALGRNNSPYRFWTEEELQMLTRQCGLVNFKAITKDPAFIMVRVQKPKNGEIRLKSDE